ncbi:MAG: hypothetical protein LBQ20_11410 [Rhodanobacter sp.]|jgi:hypothetical protein|nr:hypothetical protein [Rhodanobacter sp.]
MQTPGAAELLDDNTVEESAVLDQTSGLSSDWELVMQTLSAQWQANALELGVVQRRLRSFSDAASVLRVPLIHLADGCSLRETAVRTRSGGLVDVSAVALVQAVETLWRLVSMDAPAIDGGHDFCASRWRHSTGAADTTDRR